MGILWLLSCEFGACFVFFGARVGSSSPFFWKLQWSMPSVVGTLAEKRVLSSFMGVQEKQMKQRNICQVLSSELLLSDIYSCTCLMLILFYSDWPFCRRKKKESYVVLWNQTSLFSNQNYLWYFIGVIHFNCIKAGSLIQMPFFQSHLLEKVIRRKVAGTLSGGSWTLCWSGV